jgi:hypothetical protein
MIKVAITDTDKIDEHREMSESELRIILEFKPEMYIDGNDYKITSYQYDTYSGEFRIFVEKL